VQGENFRGHRTLLTQAAAFFRKIPALSPNCHELFRGGNVLAVIVFDIAGQIDGHTRGPAMLYLIWKSDPGNLLSA